jgi:anti-sigma-K factor RskA
MTKKTWILMAVAVVLVAAYAVFFTDWFQPQTVRIFHTSRNLRPRRAQGAGMTSLIFGLNAQFKLTEIKVVPLAAYQTNQNTLPLWHLVSNSNSVPVKMFFYGQSIRGLKPAVPGTRPQPLTNNVAYRLLVSAGKIKGEHDFELK